MRYILIAFFAVILLVLCARINVKFSYDNKLLLLLEILGIKFKIPIKKSVKKTKEKKDIKVAEEKINAFGLFIDLMGNTRRFAKKHISLKDFSFELAFGVDDAADTAVMTGMAWGIVYNVLGLIDKFITVFKPAVNIVPVYNNPTFKFRCSGIIAFRLVYIIPIGIIVYYKYLKYKNGVKYNERTSN